MEEVLTRADEIWQITIGWLTSTQFYLQIVFSMSAIALSYLASAGIKSRLRFFRAEPEPGPLQDVRLALYNVRELVFPILNIVFLGVAIQVSIDLAEQGWLPRIFQGWAVIFLIYSFIHLYVKSAVIRAIATWIGVPLAILYVIGWLNDVLLYLDGVAVSVGDIRLSALAIARTLLFGFILFWLGRISNDTGKRVIRNQAKMDIGTREVLAKLFEIALFACISLLLLQVMGINLTALAVFGGALGVGLGFGLQQIASNFLSGIIILLDRSITIGDFIELEDGRAGKVRELSMRSATLETFDGKDVMVPNETFITSTFTNWTHNNQKQRYPLHFSVAYDTDLEKMWPIIREVVASHPKVLSGDTIPIEERPDAEIASFGDSGIEILVEFWMEGIDDGPNRVGADLLMMIWTALKLHGIQIPFPQREIRVLNDQIGVRTGQNP